MNSLHELSDALDEIEEKKTNPLVFTRYLYSKEEVYHSLLIALLEKQLDEALYWTYEIYFSGFEEELWLYIKSVYEQFYQLSNVPALGTCLEDLYQKWLDEPSENRMFGSMIKNLITRPYNVVLFMETYMAVKCEPYVPCVKPGQQYPPGTQENYNCLSSRNPITGKGKEFECPEGAGGGKGYRGHEVASTLRREAPLREPGVPPKPGKFLRLNMAAEEVAKYETIVPEYQKARFLLPKVYRYPIRKNVGKLFQRSFCDIKQPYRYNWTYYCWDCPFWRRIMEGTYGGKVNHENWRVDFDDDCAEEFYDHFGYEPDEQKFEIQAMSIGLGNTVQMTIKDFAERYGAVEGTGGSP